MKLTDEEIEIKETYTSKIGAWKMNREILFKAKRKDWRNLPKERWWIEGYYVYCRKRHYILPVLNKAIGFDEREDEWIELDPETICWYTGLCDKNGRKIWENDIVQAWSEGSNAIGKVIRRVDGLYIMYPAYQKKEFWGLYPNENGKTTVEVIGNIFDNPELLEVE